jgi:hypothetical protein
LLKKKRLSTKQNRSETGLSEWIYEEEKDVRSGG